MFSREQILIAVAAMVVAGLTGGAVVGFAVRGEDNARDKLPSVPEPALIRADGRGHLATDTPTGAVLELWSSAQWGDVPAILRLQDPVVRQTLGDTVVAGIYAHQRPRMVTRRPRIVSTDVRGQIATVRYRLQGEPTPALPQLAILRRRGPSWFLRYDTFLEDAVPFYVIAANGGETAPRRGDRLQGANTAASYRRQAGSLSPIRRAQTP